MGSRSCLMSALNVQPLAFDSRSSKPWVPQALDSCLVVILFGLYAQCKFLCLNVIRPSNTPGGFEELIPELGGHQRNSTIQRRLVFWPSFRDNILAPTAYSGVVPAISTSEMRALSRCCAKGMSPQRGLCIGLAARTAYCGRLCDKVAATKST